MRAVIVAALAAAMLITIIATVMASPTATPTATPSATATALRLTRTNENEQDAGNMGKAQRWRGRVFEAEPIDRLADLFAGDAILSSQFFGLRRSVSPTYRPIQRLMLATLADAMNCFLNYAEVHPVSRRGRLRSEAGRWLFDEAAAGAFSFGWICDGLGIDAAYLRGGIRRLAGSSNGL